jgi:Domain of unknown function DUF29
VRFDDELPLQKRTVFTGPVGALRDGRPPRNEAGPRLPRKVLKRRDGVRLWVDAEPVDLSANLLLMQRTAPAGYDDDFALWAEAQAVALREQRWDDLDVAHIAEEMDGLARSDRREIRSRLIQIAVHLLKQQYQPERASSSWRTTILVQVTDIDGVLEDSPSLRREIPGFVAYAYPRARRIASSETGLPIETFPEAPTPEFERALAAALAGDDLEF